MKRSLFSRLFPLLLALSLILGSALLAGYCNFYGTATPIYWQLNNRAAIMPAKEFLRIDAVNLNTANQEELMTLPGIGEIISKRILDYRAAHGPFGSLNELQKIKGIGKKTVRKLGEYAYLE